MLAAQRTYWSKSREKQRDQLDQDGIQRGDEKRLNTRYILKIALTGFVDKLDGEYEKEDSG